MALLPYLFPGDVSLHLIFLHLVQLPAGLPTWPAVLPALPDNGAALPSSTSGISWASACSISASTKGFWFLLAYWSFCSSSSNLFLRSAEYLFGSSKVEKHPQPAVCPRLNLPIQYDMYRSWNSLLVWIQASEWMLFHPSIAKEFLSYCLAFAWTIAVSRAFSTKTCIAWFHSRCLGSIRLNYATCPFTNRLHSKNLIFFSCHRQAWNTRFLHLRTLRFLRCLLDLANVHMAFRHLLDKKSSQEPGCLSYNPWIYQTVRLDLVAWVSWLKGMNSDSELSWYLQKCPFHCTIWGMWVTWRNLDLCFFVPLFGSNICQRSDGGFTISVKQNFLSSWEM